MSKKKGIPQEWEIENHRLKMHRDVSVIKKVQMAGEKNRIEGFREEFITYLKIGIKIGRLRSKREVLILLIDKEFGFTEEEKGFINTVTDSKKLNQAINAVLFTKTKNEVFALLQ